MRRKLRQGAAHMLGRGDGEDGVAAREPRHVGGGGEGWKVDIRQVHGIAATGRKRVGYLRLQRPDDDLAAGCGRAKGKRRPPGSGSQNADPFKSGLVRVIIL